MFDDHPHGPTCPASTAYPLGDEEARQAWAADPQLREEFNGDFKAYAAFHLAMQRGQVRFAPRRRS